MHARRVLPGWTLISLGRRRIAHLKRGTKPALHRDVALESGRQGDEACAPDESGRHSMTQTPTKPSPSTAILLRVLCAIGVFPSSRSGRTPATGVCGTPQAMHRALELRTPSELSARSWVEACVNDTVSAAIAADKAERATDPGAKAALSAVSEDEAAHAELAWRRVAWALEAGGCGVRRAVEQAFRRSADVAWRGKGDHALVDRALAEVVTPTARALLAKDNARQLAEKAA
jgi:hypothetical protein